MSFLRVKSALAGFTLCIYENLNCRVDGNLRLGMVSCFFDKKYYYIIIVR